MSPIVRLHKYTRFPAEQKRKKDAINLNLLIENLGEKYRIYPWCFNSPFMWCFVTQRHFISEWVWSLTYRCGIQLSYTGLWDTKDGKNVIRWQFTGVNPYESRILLWIIINFCSSNGTAARGFIKIQLCWLNIFRNSVVLHQNYNSR